MGRSNCEMFGVCRTLKRGGTVGLMLVFSFCGMMATDVLAASGADASKCTFKVQKKSGNRQKVEGGYSTTLKISEIYDAEIRWRGEDSVQLSVETVYMVSEDKRSFPYSSAVYYIEMPPSSTTNLVLETPEFVKKDYDYGSSYGIKLEGIIARLMKNGEVLKVYTSKNDSKWKKLANEKVIKTKGVTNPYGAALENVQSRLIRIRAGETAPSGSAQKDMSPAAFIVDRPNKLVAFSAMASLSNDYYGDFYGLGAHYYCVSLVLRKQGTPVDTSYYYDGSGSANRYVRAYVSRKTALGQQIRTILGDGKRHDVNVNLHFPPTRTVNSSYSSSSTPCCFLDMMVTNAAATAVTGGSRQSPLEIRTGERFSRRSGMNSSRGEVKELAPDADSSYEVESFCGYKFGSDYRGSNQSNGGYSSSPDMVRMRLERPFRNFKFATLNHGKAGMQSVALYFYDEAHAMKDEDLNAEVETVKGILEKKYGVKFRNSTAQRGKMHFSVYKSGNGIRLEVTNRAVVRRGQNFGADGGASVL